MLSNASSKLLGNDIIERYAHDLDEENKTFIKEVSTLSTEGPHIRVNLLEVCGAHTHPLYYYCHP